LCGDEQGQQRPTLVDSLRGAGVHTALIGDNAAVARHPLAAGFDEAIDIGPPLQTTVAESIEQTHFARCFSQIIEWIEAAEGPFMLWCHLAGLGTAWDAPLEFRRGYMEEGDPEPPDWANVPDLLLDENYDPDELLGITQTYSGQVSLLDTCLGALSEFLEETGIHDDTALLLTSPRGFPLGEHRRVGPCKEEQTGEALYGELVHVPLIARFPGVPTAMARSSALAEPSDIWATLADYFDLKNQPQSPTAASLMPIIREEVETLRDRLCIAGGGDQHAIRTPAWYMRVAHKPELFAKPDDRWEVNDTAARCRDVVRKLNDIFPQYAQLIESGGVDDLPPLDDVLLEGIE